MDIFEKDLENKRVFMEAKEQYGSIVSPVFYEILNGKERYIDTEVALTQQAYIDGQMDEAPVYKALGIDDEGNKYEIEWSVKDNWEQIEDEEEMCDWDSPVSVEKV